ncbi:PAS domain-containing protein, partial [Bacillus sp. SIMBA_074]
QDAEWDRYEQWALVNPQGQIVGWVKTAELYRHFFRVYKEKQANYSLELEAVFNTSYDMFYISDGKGITQRVSRSSERLYGYSPEDLVGKS